MLKSVKKRKGGPLQIGPHLRVKLYRHGDPGTQKLYRHFIFTDFLPTSAFRAGETLAWLKIYEMCLK